MRAVQTTTLLAICGIFSKIAMASTESLVPRNESDVEAWPYYAFCCFPGCSFCWFKRCATDANCTASLLYTECCSDDRALLAKFFDDDNNEVENPIANLGQ